MLVLEQWLKRCCRPSELWWLLVVNTRKQCGACVCVHVRCIPYSIVTIALSLHTYSYDAKLKEARLLGAKKGFSVGIALFLTFFLIFCVDGVAFGFGGWLISEGYSEGGNILTVSGLCLCSTVSECCTYPLK